MPAGNRLLASAEINTPRPSARESHLRGRLASGHLVIAGDGVLVQSGDQCMWRVHAYLTSLTRAPVGSIGEIEVDGKAGDILSDQQTIGRMYACGERFIGST